MRILSTIVQIPARAVTDIGQDLTMRGTVAAQAIGDEAARLVLQPVQQSFEKPLRRRCIPPTLHQNVQHNPVLVHCAPQIMQHAVNPDEDLVEVLRVSRFGSPPSEPPGEVRTKLPAPVPDALVGHDHASFGEDQLDVPQTEAEDVIQPDGVSDYHGRKAMARIGGGLRRHPGSLAQYLSGH